MSRTPSLPGPDATLWTGRSSQWLNLKTYLVAALGFWLVIPLLFALGRYLEVRCRVYELTSERLRVSRGVLSKRIDELELYRVKDISVDRPFWLRLFGLGSLVLDTSDHTTPQVVIAALPDYDALRARLRERVETRRRERGVTEVDFTAGGPAR